MSYLIAICITFFLLVAFVFLSWFETKQGVRLFSGTRARLDKQVARAVYVARHIDWTAFFAHMVKTTSERVAHDAVHTTLLAVRASERALTRIIRTLRERVAERGDTAPEPEGSPLIATIVRFRKTLRKGTPGPDAT